MKSILRYAFILLFSALGGQVVEPILFLHAPYELKLIITLFFGALGFLCVRPLEAKLFKRKPPPNDLSL